MKYQLIMLSEPSIVSDEQPVPGDMVFSFVTNSYTKFTDPRMFTEGTYKKVVAKKPSSINFNGFEDQVGYVDIWKKAEDMLTSHQDFKTEGMSDYQNGRLNGIFEGLQHQVLSEKKFSLEDLKTMFEAGGIHQKIEGSPSFNETMSLISKPKTFDIEVEMENKTPKLTNNKIKITKVSPTK